MAATQVEVAEARAEGGEGEEAAVCEEGEAGQGEVAEAGEAGEVAEAGVCNLEEEDPI